MRAMTMNWVRVIVIGSVLALAGSASMPKVLAGGHEHEKSDNSAATKAERSGEKSAHAAPVQPGHSEDGVDPNEAMVRLLEGNLRYVTEQPNGPDRGEARRIEVARGQHPFAAIVSCADSRVPPEIIFDQGLGDLFVVRIAGNLATDEAIGSIEYAVEHLGVRLVVVLGHEKCGAVKAALDGGHAPGRIEDLVEAIAPAVERSRTRAGDPLDNAVRANVRMVVDRLVFAEPILAEKAREGAIKIVGARYDLDNGTVETLR